MGKLIKMKVVIQGLRGIGIEVAKNFILAGPNTVYLNDSTTCSRPDMGTNFYIKEEDVNSSKTRADACLKDLQDLNPHVKVEVYNKAIDTQFLTEKNIDVVVFTECFDKEYLMQINDFCRQQKPAKGFIWTGCLGLFGYVFVDYGDSHTIFDKNGEELQSRIIQAITQEEKGLVNVIEDKRHGFEDGDYIEFTEVQGMTELNGKHFQITVKSPFTFEINVDTRKFGNYVSGGYATQVNVPFQKKFKSLRDALEDPFGPGVNEMIDPDMDFMRMFKPIELHLYINAMFEFHEKNKRLPKLMQEDDVLAFKEICKQRLEVHKEAKKDEDNAMKKIEDLDVRICEFIAFFAQIQIAPNASFYGGIVAQEIVKYTGKYTPLCQWLLYETFSTMLPADDSYNSYLGRAIDDNSRYRDMQCLFGTEVQERLLNCNYFIVGAGA